MANYGLARPYIGKLDVATGTYSNGFRCGKAVNTDITPNYNEGSLFGDNQLQEYVKEFKDADVNLGVTELPLKSADTVFGHTVNQEKKSITYKASDDSNYVGYGIYANEMVNGVKSYVGVFLPKVKFTEAAESYSTKGDAIEFKTPTLAGKAYALENGVWKERQIFETEEEVQAWLEGKVEITETENTETENTETENTETENNEATS